MLDATPIATLTAALMDRLERDYEGVDVSLRAAMVLVDVEAPDEDGDPGTWTHVRWHFADRGSGWDKDRSSSAYAAGLVAEAFQSLVEGERPPPYVEDD